MQSVLAVLIMNTSLPLTHCPQHHAMPSVLTVPSMTTSLPSTKGLLTLLCPCDRSSRGADGAAEAAAGANKGQQAGWRLPHRQAHQRAQGHRLHCLPLPQGQDLAAADPP